MRPGEEGNVQYSEPDTNQGLASTTTRRTIVKTGAKLAYAAPVVAATFKLTQGGALAASCPRGGTLDPDGPSGPGCYSCQGSRDFGCQRPNPRLCGSPRTNPSAYRACVRQQANAYRNCQQSTKTCRRAVFYNAATNRCETRSGQSGGANCAPIFTPVTTP